MLESITNIGVGGADMPDAFRRLYEKRFHRRVGSGLWTHRGTDRCHGGGCRRRAGCRSERHGTAAGDDSHRRRRRRHLGPGEVGRGMRRSRRSTGPSPTCIGRCSATGIGRKNQRRRCAVASSTPATSACSTRAATSSSRTGKNDLIIRGGANVYPAEIERVLHDVAGVAACAVVGRPDDRLGERVVAFVECSPGATLEEAALREHCLENLARYKVPDVVEFVSAFDRTPMGKIRKGPLRESAAGF